MALRCVDFKCKGCGVVFEEVVDRDNQTARHCGKAAIKVWRSAPGLAGAIRPHYSHALGRDVSGYHEEDRELAKTGSWIASKDEGNRVYDTDHFTDNVAIKRNKDVIKKHVEKAAARAVADGVITFND